jgi:hypothetical protein
VQPDGYAKTRLRYSVATMRVMANAGGTSAAYVMNGDMA